MKWPILCGVRCRGLWWFRVCGWGLLWKNNRIRRPLFSERMRLRGWTVGRWHFEFLRRNPGPDRQMQATVDRMMDVILSGPIAPPPPPS
jgi:hypothetical protein